MKQEKRRSTGVSPSGVRECPAIAELDGSLFGGRVSSLWHVLLHVLRYIDSAPRPAGWQTKVWQLLHLLLNAALKRRPPLLRGPHLILWSVNQVEVPPQDHGDLLTFL